MNLRLIAGTFGIAAALAACGGGGSGATPPANNATPTPTPAQTPSTTNAVGTVVDDGTGMPLGGVRVVLMPWAPCGPTPAPATSITPENDGCPTPLPSPQVTTAGNGSFALDGVPNGHYLLVIGTDSTSTTGAVQATVHDNITLNGGNQSLDAPTLPAVSGVTIPTWESDGMYRIATLNATTEVPCFQAWQSQRATNNLAAGTIDEWLLENVRSINIYAQSGATGSVPSITSGGTTNSGGTSCSEALVDPYLFSGVNAYALDLRTEWFAGQWMVYSANGGTNNEAAGIAEFPIDPRSNTDPNHPIWP
jgi:hypothetical protein